MIEVLGKFHGIPGVFVAALFCGTLRYRANNIAYSFEPSDVWSRVNYSFSREQHEQRDVLSKNTTCHNDSVQSLTIPYLTIPKPSGDQPLQHSQGLVKVK